MEANVALVSSRGIRFLSMNPHETKKLIALVENLKRDREADEVYQLIISYDDKPEVTCNDVWIAIGVQPSGY